jgi:uncharacterized coiled-coil DUF342 family protein
LNASPESSGSATHFLFRETEISGAARRRKKKVCDMKRQTPGKGTDALAERLRRGEKLNVEELLALMDALIEKQKNPPG